MLQPNTTLINQFEAALDPQHPERNPIPVKVLGYGEISTVLAIGSGDDASLAYKRMPMFKDAAEAAAYQSLYRDYHDLLQQAGLHLPANDLLRLEPGRGPVVLYIAQERLPAESIGHRAIHHLPEADIMRLFRAVLAESGRVFAFNQAHQGDVEIGFDGQISNWAIAGFDPAAGRLPEPLSLIYFDTSSPLIRKGGVEQLDPELFLRSAPSFLLWIIRLFLLEEVMTRYYDRRRVTVDLIANFYKEQRPELIPSLVKTANEALSESEAGPAFTPLTTAEIAAYYKDDARTWRIYLAFRKADRALHRLTGKPYPYILPAKIKR